MGKLISRHSALPYTKLLALVFIALGLTLLTVGILQSSSNAFQAGLFFSIGPIILITITGQPAGYLEIYECGIKYKTSWRTRTWSWSDIVGITPSSRRLSSPVFTHINGDYISFESVSEWRTVVQYVVSNVHPLIYHNMLSAINDGKTVEVNSHLSISKIGFSFRGFFIEWTAVKSIRMNKSVLVIEGQSRHNEWQRLNVWLRSTPNATIFAELIPKVWQEAINSPRPIEPTYVVIEGIQFNSEGEIINHAADN